MVSVHVQLSEDSPTRTLNTAVWKVCQHSNWRSCCWLVMKKCFGSMSEADTWWVHGWKWVVLVGEFRFKAYIPSDISAGNCVTVVMIHRIMQEQKVYINLLNVQARELKTELTVMQTIMPHLITVTPMKPLQLDLLVNIFTSKSRSWAQFNWIITTGLALVWVITLGPRTVDTHQVKGDDYTSSTHQVASTDISNETISKWQSHQDKAVIHAASC